MTDRMPAYPGWQTVRRIGTGSFGTVYEIERDLFGRKEKAALKVIFIPQNEGDIEDLYASGYDEQSITAHFNDCLADIVREYSLMAEIKGHTNVVYCDDIRYIQNDDGIGWTIYIKMELLTPLTKTLGNSFSEEQVIRIGRDMANALILCRSRNIVHRDIKPQNIFVSQDGAYKLGDFGIAKTVERTSGGTKIGTYSYRAPEVYNNQPYGHSADIYSLGLVLYWLLNDRRLPFYPAPPAVPKTSEMEHARIRRFSGEPIPAPRNGSDALKKIVLKACAFDPRDRYQSAEEMLNALDEAGSGQKNRPTGIGVASSAEKAAEKAAEPELADAGRGRECRSTEEDDATVGVWGRTESVQETKKTLSDEALKSHEPAADALQNEKHLPGMDEKRRGDLTEGRKEKAGSALQDAAQALTEDTAVSREERAEEPFSKKTRQLALTAGIIIAAVIGLICFLAVKNAPLKVGDTVRIGRFEQNGNLADGAEQIEWIVLAVQGSKALVISRAVLDQMTYSPGGTDWESSNIRAYLNYGFYDTVFTSKEKSRIRETRIENVTDRVFLLSDQDVMDYFAPGKRVAELTKAAAASSGEKRATWWLRSGMAVDYVNGSIVYWEPSSPLGIRPAMWITRYGSR